jgi:hypothetical protein
MKSPFKSLLEAAVFCARFACWGECHHCIHVLVCLLCVKSKGLLTYNESYPQNLAAAWIRVLSAFSPSSASWVQALYDDLVIWLLLEMEQKLRTHVHIIYNIGLHFFPACLHSLLFGVDVSQSGVMAFCHGYSWWWCWVWHFVSGGTHKAHVVTFQRVVVELFCAAISMDKRLIQLVAHPKFYVWLTNFFTVCTLGWMLV